MPLYVFRCTECGTELERLLSLRDDPESVRCPECGAAVRRVISTFASTGGSHASTCAPTMGGG